MRISPPIRRCLAVAGAGALALGLAGCATSYAPILDPQGPVALGQRDIMFRAFGIMMIVVLPVFVLAAIFVWRYRASNAKARFEPEWESNGIDALTWIVPALIWATLAYHVWVYTHAFDPYKPLDPYVKPLEVQAVAQDWKWLFIYPEEGIASVNEIAFPAGRPVTFRITSDTVMNSFFIPALGSQIYAMAGMETRLNLLADRPGAFRGRNTQYSGDGFPDQHFAALSMTAEDFDAWVAKAKASGEGLDAAAYEALAKPSSKHPVTYYATVEPGLFGHIIARYDGAMAMTAMDHGGAAAE
ncbi:MAG: ubiquinol oxidase subunit II [Bauldia sp.]|nr:ubiquinol oxidase subunit II [Bauldia sp.]